jgi:hypothetical protein
MDSHYHQSRFNHSASIQDLKAPIGGIELSNDYIEGLPMEWIVRK